MMESLAKSGLNYLTTQDVVKFGLVVCGVCLVTLFLIVLCIVAGIRGIQRLLRTVHKRDERRHGFEMKVAGEKMSV